MEYSIFFVFWGICALLAALIASSRGRSPVAWFFLGLLTSFIAVILVAVLPSRRA